MSNDNDTTRFEADVEALREWWRGDREQPFVLETRDTHAVCDVMFPSALAKLRMNLRGLALLLIARSPSSWLKVRLFRLFGAKIGRRVYIAPQVVLDLMFPSLIELGDGAFLGMGCRLFAHEIRATSFRLGRVRVGPGSVVGAYSTVRPGVTIGSRATVGFNSLVTRDVPDGQTVGGVPARPIGAGGEDA